MTMTAELTQSEAEVAKMLGDVWNAYLNLPVEHPNEKAEFCHAIHACQDMILSRCGRRAFAKGPVNEPD